MKKNFYKDLVNQGYSASQIKENVGCDWYTPQIAGKNPEILTIQQCKNICKMLGINLKIFIAKYVEPEPSKKMKHYHEL